MKYLKASVAMILISAMCACATHNASYSEKSISIANNKNMLDSCYREASKNPNVQKIDREVIPDPAIMTASQVNSIKNTDKKLSPEQKSALIVFNSLISNCDSRYINSMIDEQQRQSANSIRLAVERQRNLLISGEITIKEFNKRFDQIVAGVKTSNPNLSIQPTSISPSSSTTYIVVPKNSGEIRSMGEAPTGYVNQNTNPWQSRPAVNCTPTAAGGFVCQ